MSAPRHRPGSVWMLRRPKVKVGQTNGLVRTLDENHIGIGVWGNYAVGPGCISLTRRDARLLAKRDRDLPLLERLSQRLNALADGNFA